MTGTILPRYIFQYCGCQTEVHHSSIFALSDLNILLVSIKPHLLFSIAYNAASENPKPKNVLNITEIVIFRPYFIWKRKIFKSNGFFLQNLPSTKFISKLKGFTHRIQVTKISIMRYVFVEILDFFG